MSVPKEVFEAALKRPEALISLLRSERELSRLDRIALAMHLEKRLNPKGPKPKHFREADAWDRYRQRAEVWIDFGKLSKEGAAKAAAYEALKSGDVSEKLVGKLEQNVLDYLRRAEASKPSYERRGESIEEWLREEFREYKEAQRNRSS